MGLPLQTIPFYDLGGGPDLKSSPTKGTEDDASDTLNCDFSIDGSFGTRNGSTIVNQSGGIPAQIAGAPRTLFQFDYKKSDGTDIQIICAGTSIYHNLITPSAQVTGLSATLPIPDIEFQVTLDDEYAFWGNGVDTNLKFNGTTWTNWSIATPASALVAADGGAGTLSAGDYTWYVSFARTVAGVIVQESDLSAISNTLTLAASHFGSLSSIPVSTDTQVNARVIYRSKNGGTPYRVTSGATITDNTTTTYTDDTETISVNAEAAFDNQPAKTSKVFEEYLGRMYVVDAANPTDVYASKVNRPWNCPDENLIIFDGPVKCIKRMFGVLIFGTDKSLWVLNGDFATNDPNRVSSNIGILNNRCAVGESILYILATNKKFYALSPTDFSQNEIRLGIPRSIRVDPVFNNISNGQDDNICMTYYTAADVAKVMIACPISSTTNNYVLVYNETQSILKDKAVWQIWNNLNCSALRVMKISGEIGLYAGDYNGFIWKIDDPSKHGDGAEENGTATSATATTLTDSSKTWTVNKFVGVTVKITSGTGVGQSRVISANTATQFTVPTWTTTPDSTSVYTIGGYDSFTFSNWKMVVNSYDVLKQLWFVFLNANANGTYSIDMIIQSDFNVEEADQITIPVTLAISTTIWGSFVWGQASWASSGIFSGKYRQFKRFKSMRIGFRNKEAGQPFKINGYSLSVQDKGLYMRNT